MHRCVRALITPALAAALLVGCASGTTVYTSILTDVEVAQLAAAWDETAASALDALGEPSTASDATPAQVTTSFSQSRLCPLEGRTTVAGTRVADGDRDAGTLTVRLTASRTDDSCAFEIRQNEIITITTTPSIQLVAEQSFTRDGGFGVRTTTHTGRFAFNHSGGGSGMCDVALTAIWNPAAGSYSLSGSFCGRGVQMIRSRGA